MQYAYFCYHRRDDNVLETCVNSLRLVSREAEIIICTDGVPDELKDRLGNEYGVRWVVVPSNKMIRRRATCKIEVLNDFARRLRDDDEVLVSDVDVYFKADPFTAFNENPDMDLGLTSRGYKYMFPINGGIFYIRISDKMKHWLNWHVRQILSPTWEPYVRLRRSYNHERYGLDWSVGQDFLIANWINREQIKIDRDINVVDVGPRYNFCPPTDLLGEKAFVKVKAAFKNPDIATIHLKSELKKMIYEPDFPNAKLNYPKGTFTWM